MKKVPRSEGARVRPVRRSLGEGGRSEGPKGRTLWWGAALIVAAGFAVYWNSFGNPFVFDDHATLADNPHIRSFQTMFQTDPGSALTGRPVVSASFALNYALDGLNVTGYRVVNVGLHVICGLLIFGIVRQTLHLPKLRERWGQVADGLALAAALLWTVHPLNTEAVDYLTQRTEGMMAVCYLVAVYGSVRALVPGFSGTASRAWTTVAIASCAVGMLCKEPMATAPIVVVLYDAVFVFDSIAEAFRRRWRFYAGLAATWIIVVVSVATASRELSGGYATTHVSAWSYLLNQTVVITHYLQLVIWPQGLVAYYGWSLPATIVDVLPYALFITAAFAASVVALVRWPRVGFLALWFFITLGPTSSFLPVAAEVGADRRMYVPLMGLVVLGVVLGRLLIERFARPGDSRASDSRSRAGARHAASVSVALVAIASVGLAARTVARNRDYASELTLSETTLAAWPSGVAHDMVGLSLVKLGRHDEAVRELRLAVKDYPPARYDLGAQLFTLGKIDEAMVELGRFVAQEPGKFTASAAHTLLGRALAAKNRLPEAIEQFRLAIGGPFPDPQAHAFLADLLQGGQHYAEAIDHYRAYLAAFPGDARAAGNLGIALASANRREEAVAAFRLAADLAPEDAGARENLARMLLEMGQIAAGAAEAQRTVAIAPGRATAHDLLGQALVALNRLPEARQEFERALQLDPNFVEAREHLRRIGR